MGGGGSCLKSMYGMERAGAGTGTARFICSTTGGGAEPDGGGWCVKGECEGSGNDGTEGSSSWQSGIVTSTLKLVLMKSAMEALDSKADMCGLATAVEAALSKTSELTETEE